MQSDQCKVQNGGSWFVVRGSWFVVVGLHVPVALWFCGSVVVFDRSAFVCFVLFCGHSNEHGLTWLRISEAVRRKSVGRWDGGTVGRWDGGSVTGLFLQPMEGYHNGWRHQTDLRRSSELPRRDVPCGVKGNVNGFNNCVTGTYGAC